MKFMSMKKIAFTFPFRSPDHETCPGYFTHSIEFLCIPFRSMYYIYILNGRKIYTLQGKLHYIYLLYAA